MLFNLLQKFPNDTGPIYQETINRPFPVEPFNTLSNLIFIAIIFYFSKKISRYPKQHPFLLFAIPTIFISWIGGTMFHGTRNHQFWLYLDWIPIMLVCIGAIGYLITKIYNHWWKRITIFISLIIISILVRRLPLPSNYRISFGYLVTSLTLIIPFIWYAYKTQWKNINYILTGFIVFGLALVFRTLDNTINILPMGTHWLWHIFGGIAVFYLLKYLYLDVQKLT